MKSIGVDLGWASGATGLALLETRQGELHFLEGARILDLRGILAWIQERAGNDCVVAVDAPLRISNASGMRECEKQAHRLYGRFDAGCYPSNQASSFAARTTGFSQALADMGFVHSHEPAPRGRWQFECFPHIAAVELFGLDRILKYKKGVRANRLVELRRLARLISEQLGICNLVLPEIPERRGDLKPAEDRLDAILCAFAAHYWREYGYMRNRILGDPAEGCMIVPGPVLTERI